LEDKESSLRELLRAAIAATIATARATAARSLSSWSLLVTRATAARIAALSFLVQLAPAGAALRAAVARVAVWSALALSTYGVRKISQHA